MPSETTLFIEHRRSLVDFAAGILGSRAHAEDVVHEAYIRFSAAEDRAATRVDEPILHPLAYLHTIVRNLALTWVRRSSFETPVAPTDVTMISIPSDAPSAESTLMHREELWALAEALTELPPRTQLAFNLHRIEGWPLREVAERLGVSVARAQQLAKAAMVHATKRLRERSR